MKILIQQVVIPDYRLGFFSALRQELVDCKVSVLAGEEDFTITPRSSSEAWDLYEKITNHYFFKRKLLWQCILLRAARSDLVILNSNTRILSNWAILVLRKLFLKKTYLWGHVSGKNTRFNSFRDLFIRLSDGFIAYTESQKASLLSKNLVKRVVSANNACLSVGECDFIEKPSYKLNAIVYVGRLIKAKKVELLIRAFAQSVKKGTLPSDVALVIVGKGAEREALESTVETEAIKNVFFKGHVIDSAELKDIYSTAFASISPGYVGLSATQSFSFGVPMCVSKDEFHSPEIEACIEPFNTKFFHTDDIDSLSEALEHLYKERDFYHSKRAEICQWTQNNYSFESMAKSFKELLFNL